MYLSLLPSPARFGEIRGFCQLLPASQYLMYPAVFTCPHLTTDLQQLTASFTSCHSQICWICPRHVSLPVFSKNNISYKMQAKPFHSVEGVIFQQPFVMCAGKCPSMVPNITFRWEKLLIAPPKPAQAEFLQNLLWLDILGLCCVSDMCHHLTAALLSSQLPGSRLILSFL